jgi:hypothetical protein
MRVFQNFPSDKITQDLNVRSKKNRKSMNRLNTGDFCKEYSKIMERINKTWRATMNG